MNYLAWTAFVIGCCVASEVSPDRAEDTIVFSPYVYSSEVISVYDADTLTVETDLGFGIKLKQTLRLYGIDAWELRGEEKPKGVIARDWFKAQIPEDQQILIRSIKDTKGKYGRYLVIVYVKDGEGYRNLNEELVTHGHAEHKEY